MEGGEAALSRLFSSVAAEGHNRLPSVKLRNDVKPLKFLSFEEYQKNHKGLHKEEGLNRRDGIQRAVRQTNHPARTNRKKEEQ